MSVQVGSTETRPKYVVRSGFRTKVPTIGRTCIAPLPPSTSSESTVSPAEQRQRIYAGTAKSLVDVLAIAEAESRKRGRDDHREDEPSKKGSGNVERGNDRREDERQRAGGWDPELDGNVLGDPYATCIVARLPYSATATAVQAAMNQFGRVSRCRIVTDVHTGRPRGYGFVVYESRNDMQAAVRYSNANGGVDILSTKCVVDWERGRTTRHWRPSRLGGGLGGRTSGKKQS